MTWRQREETRAIQAEARVEALERQRDYAEEALTAMWQRYVLERTEGSRAANLAESVLRERDKRVTAARAVLACPPEEEK